MDNRKTTSARAVGVLLTGLLLGGCGSDGGSSNQKLEDAISLEGAAFVIVDVGSGRAYGRASVSDPTSYTGSEMLFKRVEAGTGIDFRGVSGDGAAFTQSDEVATGTNSGSHGTFYLAVMECTQTQWKAMAGSQPWTTLSSELSTANGPAAAHNLSFDTIDDAMSTLNGRLNGGSVRLPSSLEWEAAARLDATSVDYTFGDNGDGTATPSNDPVVATATVASHAWTFETASGAVGPFTVGQLAASPGGFYDLHGNVWEPVASDVVRGGSWRDVVLQARIANENANIETDVPHPLLGLRLALDLK